MAFNNNERSIGLGIGVDSLKAGNTTRRRAFGEGYSRGGNETVE